MVAATSAACQTAAEPGPKARVSKVMVLSSAAAATVSFALLLGTSAMLPMAWDEGNAINRAAGIADWARVLYECPSAAFSAREIAPRWRYTVEIEGHPALYGIVIALGEWLGQIWLPPLTAARLGPMALFAGAVGAMFYKLARQYSFMAALASTAALVTMPRVFSHAHFASFDGPLTSCWVLAWAFFPPTRDEGGWRSALVWGLALGATLSCKFTGWAAPLPFIGYVLVYGDRRCAWMLAIGLAAAAGTFWLLNPRLWHHPIDGTAAFFELNLGRAGTPLDIATTFFGVRYRSIEGLPWYNALVWTGITVPIGTLLLAGVGIIGALRRWATDGDRMLVVANWVVLLAIKAWPGTPVHDAERLILPSFAFLAILAGVGCHDLFEWAGQQRVSRCVIVSLAIALSYAGSTASVIWYAPQWLSYYSLLICGLRGADAAGMEATYYWDAFDREVLAWLHEHTAPGDKIEFSAPSEENLALMRQWGILKRDWRADQPGKYRWRVIQRRPTFWTAHDRALVECGSPAFRKTIRPTNFGIGAWRLDVPLIEVFSAEGSSQKAAPHGRGQSAGP